MTCPYQEQEAKAIQEHAKEPCPVDTNLSRVAILPQQTSYAAMFQQIAIAAIAIAAMFQQIAIALGSQLALESVFAVAIAVESAIAIAYVVAFAPEST